MGEEIAHCVEHRSSRGSLMTRSRGLVSDDSPVVEQVSAPSEALPAAVAGA